MENKQRTYQRKEASIRDLAYIYIIDIGRVLHVMKQPAGVKDVVHMIKNPDDMRPHSLALLYDMRERIGTEFISECLGKGGLSESVEFMYRSVRNTLTMRSNPRREEVYEEALRQIREGDHNPDPREPK